MADVDTWLLVFAGATDWGHIVAQGVTSVRPAHTDAHHMLFLQVGATAKRSSLLLVHWSSFERDALLSTLGTHWDYGFINAVSDLTETDVKLQRSR